MAPAEIEQAQVRRAWLAEGCDIIERLSAVTTPLAMDQLSFQRLLRRTVALPVVLLVLLAATLVAEILLLSWSLRWVDHSDQVTSQARTAMRSVAEMDTGLRGYYLTGDQTFLDSYNDLKAKLPEQLDTTMQLIADNPEPAGAVA